MDKNKKDYKKIKNYFFRGKIYEGKQMARNI
jgi:hypothetical protein